jgi:hypothetical protein
VRLSRCLFVLLFVCITSRAIADVVLIVVGPAQSRSGVNDDDGGFCACCKGGYGGERGTIRLCCDMDTCVSQHLLVTAFKTIGSTYAVQLSNRLPRTPCLPRCQPHVHTLVSDTCP